jgi:hypothetical protein
MLAESFAHQREWDVPRAGIRLSKLGASVVSEFEFIEHGDQPTYWQVWHVVGQRHAAFVTYTCDPGDADVELANRQRIVESMQLT